LWVFLLGLANYKMIAASFDVSFDLGLGGFVGG